MYRLEGVLRWVPVLLAKSALVLSGCGPAAQPGDADAANDSNGEAEAAPDITAEAPDVPDIGPETLVDGFEATDVEPDAVVDGFEATDVEPDAVVDGFEATDVESDGVVDGLEATDVRDDEWDAGDGGEAGADACVWEGPEVCDGLDNDCDGLTDEDGACECVVAGDCDDANPCTTDECVGFGACINGPLSDGLSCPAGLCCGGVCRDTRTDPLHCGACGSTCLEPGESCGAGACACPASSWSVELVDAEHAVGAQPGLARDPAGNLYVAYYDATAADLRFAVHPATGFWNSTGSEHVSSVTDSAVAVDPGGTPHVVVALDGFEGYALHLATPRDGGDWGLERTGIASGGGAIEAAYDRRGGLHVLFADATALRHAYRDPAGAWSVGTVDDSPGFGGYLRLAVDGAGGFHLAYVNSATWEHRYAWSSEGDAWSWSTVETAAGWIPHVGIAIDETVRPAQVHLLYAGDRHAWRAIGTTSWSFEDVESAPRSYPASASSFAVTADGTWHAVFCDETNRALRHAFRPPSGSWTIDTLYVGDRYSFRCDQVVSDLAGDPGGGLHLAFQAAKGVDSSGQALLFYGYRPAGSGWSLQPLVPWREVPLAVTLPRRDVDVTTYGAARVFVATGDLLHDRPVGRGWQAETVDAVGDTGRYASTAVAPDGTIQVAYYDATNADLRHAVRALDGSWAIATVDASGAVGRFAALAIDPSATTHIAYYDETNGDLRYARSLAGGGWDLATVDAGPGIDVGRAAAIAVDTAGAAHVVYADLAAAGVRYARRDPVGGDWTIESLDCGCGGTAANSAIALDAAGGVHVALGSEFATIHGYRPSPTAVWSFEAVSYPFDTTCAGTALDRARKRAIFIEHDQTIHIVSPGSNILFYARRPAGGSTWGAEWIEVPWRPEWTDLVAGAGFVDIVAAACDSMVPAGGLAHLGHVRACLPE